MIELGLNDGVYEEKLEYTITYGENYSLPIPTSNEGTFNGWYFNDTKFTDKEGNSINPYLFTEDITLVAIYYFEVLTKEDLLNINNDLEATYRLVNDVDISFLGWVPVGTLENPFKEKLEGNGFTIIGLTITSPYDYLGLIGYNKGLVKELNLSDVNINVTGNIQQIIYAGSLIGFNKGEIYDTKALSGELNLKIRGGLVGYNETSNDSFFSNLENRTNIKSESTKYTGGLIGY